MNIKLQTYLFFILSSSTLAWSMQHQKKSEKPIFLQLCDTAEHYRLAKWKLKESNTLYKDYLTQKYSSKQRSISIVQVNPNIETHDVFLFDQALDQKPGTDQGPGTFYNYYHNLSNEDRTALLRATGKYGCNDKSKKLNAKRLMMQLLVTCFDKEFIAANMLNVFLPERRCSNNFLITQFIQNSIDNNSLRTLPSCSYRTEGIVKMETDCTTHYLPRTQNIRFKGLSKATLNMYNGKKYFDLYRLRESNKQYHITLGDLENNQNARARTIWTIELKENRAVEKMSPRVLKHTHKITSIACNENKLCFASNSLHGQLMLTNLQPTEDELYNPEYNPDTLLVAHGNNYHHVCFNYAGTLLAATKMDISNLTFNSPLTIQGKIHFWDVLTHEKIAQELVVGDYFPVYLFFNDNDTRLVVVAALLANRQNAGIMLWDMDTQKQLALIVSENYVPQIVTFDNNNSVIIPTRDKIFILNVQTGEILKEVIHTDQPAPSYQLIAPVIFDNDKTFLFLGMNRDDKSSCIKIINLDTKQCVSAVEHEQGGLTHIGVTFNRKQILSIFDNYTMIETHSYSDEEKKSYDQLNKESVLYQYLLWRFVVAKKEETKLLFHESLYDYLESNNLIKKYLLKNKEKQTCQ